LVPVVVDPVDFFFVVVVLTTVVAGAVVFFLAGLALATGVGDVLAAGGVTVGDVAG
jgi:hypothetical protein